MTAIYKVNCLVTAWNDCFHVIDSIIDICHTINTFSLHVDDCRPQRLIDTYTLIWPPATLMRHMYTVLVRVTQPLGISIGQMFKTDGRKSLYDVSQDAVMHFHHIDSIQQILISLKQCSVEQESNDRSI